LIDGELPPEELDLVLARLDADAALRERVARYSRIGACLRGAPGGSAVVGVAERVRAELLAEQAPLSAPRSRGPTWRGWALGGMAAAVAGVALLVNRPMAEGPEGAGATASMNTEEPSKSDGLTSVTVPVRHRLAPDAAARLTGYLMAHGEYAPGLSRSTVDSHLVAARTERASWSRVQAPGDAR
jgi:negative regulator of sigma E activity